MYNLITKIRNALYAKQINILIPMNKTHLQFLNVLYRAGFISNFKIHQNQLLLDFKYDSFFQPVILSIQIISKPSKSIYIQYHNIKSLQAQHSIFILHTSKGILTHEEALKMKLGGQLICKMN